MFGSDQTTRNPTELPVLLRALDREIEQALLAERVYAINDYGWINHDEADPDYIGHMLWQTDPPFQPDFATLGRSGLVKYEPTLRDEVLTRSGEDFEAVMIATRQAMGMAMVRARSAQSTALGGPEGFWQDYSICTMLLAVASDRLRDFLVMAIENAEYDSRRSEKDQGTLIRRAIEKVPGLAILANRSQQFKQIRNEIVHQIATQAARRSVNTLETQRVHARSGLPVEIWEPTFEEFQAVVLESREPSINVQIEELKDWYHCLIEASNLVFKAENALRRGQ